MSFNVIDQYESFVSNSFIKRDSNQIKLLKQVYSSWNNFNENSFFFKNNKKHGVYVHGSVGTGKTFLLKLICQFTKVGKKIHFNHLMNEIHDSININNNKEKKLEKYIKNLILKINILFIDELHIYNIVDALLVNKIFKLFARYKIFVIISSNFHPNELYKDGLQRNDFLPFINYLIDDFKVIEIENKTDYRRLTLNQSKTYFTPINKDTREEFKILFERLVDITSIISKTIKTKSRSLLIESCSANVALCSFDLLKISDYFHALFA